jgi:hypothetical protein
MLVLRPAYVQSLTQELGSRSSESSPGRLPGQSGEEIVIQVRTGGPVTWDLTCTRFHLHPFKIIYPNAFSLRSYSVMLNSQVYHVLMKISATTEVN